MSTAMTKAKALIILAEAELIIVVIRYYIMITVWQ